MQQKFLFAVFITVLAFACKNGNEGHAHAAANNPKDSMPVTAIKKDFTGIEFAGKKDPACGMPLSAGIADTVHYKDKVYGFCSQECKDEFLKNPASYLTSLID